MRPFETYPSIYLNTRRMFAPDFNPIRDFIQDKQCQYCRHWDRDNIIMRPSRYNGLIQKYAPCLNEVPEETTGVDRGNMVFMAADGECPRARECFEISRELLEHHPDLEPLVREVFKYRKDNDFYETPKDMEEEIAHVLL